MNLEILITEKNINYRIDLSNNLKKEPKKSQTLKKKEFGFDIRI